MLRKIAALVPFLGLAAMATDARAIGFDPYGTGAPKTDWDAPKVAPRTSCRSLMLYAADVPAEANKTRKYRFTGECTFNVAPEGRRAVMRTVDVLIDAEWSPLLKRASERVVVQDPDLGTQFSTWATCTSDPFTASSIFFNQDNCKDKGMGAHKFSAFISRDDAPFATGRVTGLGEAVHRVGANKAKIWENPTITRVRPIGIRTVNEEIYVTIDSTGGAGICPMEVDFGDGAKKKLIIWGGEGYPFMHQVKHAYTKPGAFKVTARALPGCQGEALAYAIVK